MSAEAEGFDAVLLNVGTNDSGHDNGPAWVDAFTETYAAFLRNLTVWHANPALPIKSVADLVKAAKANPGKLTYGSSGNLGSPHLAGELFELMTGTDMVHVPYKGAATAMVDLIGGRISLSFASLPSAISHIRGGRLTAIAVTSEKRFPLTPDLPTVSESGLPGFETTAWQGLVAPAKTPAAIIKRLNAEAVQVLNQPVMRERRRTAPSPSAARRKNCGLSPARRLKNGARSSRRQALPRTESTQPQRIRLNISE